MYIILSLIILSAVFSLSHCYGSLSTNMYLLFIGTNSFCHLRRKKEPFHL